MLCCPGAVQAVTAAAAMNDVGSWALVSFQATFYSRVYDLGPDVYAPALAAILPIGGIIGGVTGGLAGDWLSRRGGRQWLTAGLPLCLSPPPLPSLPQLFRHSLALCCLLALLQSFPVTCIHLKIIAALRVSKLSVYMQRMHALAAVS